ncbi:uncharacterized protein LOC113163916 isoform X2 [Anabas testudineus]|uniref:uncharacterized protein LOC113163916 isoform X2 n=1 Tax=Anabas testudineus TaxID=64144 RepID=UPI000E45740C|nr:uncharacterized protein LOC113163916 isoform X2 [Anabas testudineus]
MSTEPRSSIDGPLRTTMQLSAANEVVHSANGKQTNMLANQCHRQLKAACIPNQRQQRHAQKQQRFHDQQNSPACPQNPFLSFSAGTSSMLFEGNGRQQDEHSSELLNIEPNGSNFLDENDNKTQQGKYSLTALYYEKPRRTNLNHVGGSNFTYPQVQVSSPSPSCQLPSIPPTDDQIREYIATRLAPYISPSSQQSKKYGSTPYNIKSDFCINRDATQCDAVMPETNCGLLPTTPEPNEEDMQRQSLKCSVIKQYTANTALTLESKEPGDCTTVVSEYPQIMMNVAATCTKNEDESPLVLTAVSGMTPHKPTEKHRSCSLPQEEYVSPWLNINTNLDDIDKEFPGVPWALKSTTNQGKGGANQKAVEAVTPLLHSKVTEVSEYQTKSSHSSPLKLTSLPKKDANSKKVENTKDLQHLQVAFKQVTADSEIKSSIQILNVVSLSANHSREDLNPDVPTQYGVPTAFSENKVKEPPGDEETHSVDYLKNLQYEDISDDDSSQLLTKQASLENIKYEDISDNEDLHISNVSMETSQAPINNQQLKFEHENYGPVLDQAPTEVIADEQRVKDEPASQKTALNEMGDTAQHCSSIARTGFAEPEEGLEHLSSLKCDSEKHLGWQTNKLESCSPSSLLKDGADNEMEDDDDDDWIVIPVSIGDIEFEPNKEEEEMELVLLHHKETEEQWGATSPKRHRVNQATPEPAPAAVSSQLEVFDTWDSYLKAKSEQLNLCRSTLLNKQNPEGDPHSTQNRGESNSETEDSCDYSSESEHNYLTGNRQLLKETSAPDKETENKASNMQRDQICHKIKELLTSARAKSKDAQLKTNRQKVSEKDDVIILDSDTDDESDQNCQKKAQRILTSCSDDSGNSLHHPSQNHQTKSGPEQVDPDLNRPDITPQESILIIDSESEDEGDQNHTNRQNLLSLDSSEGGNMRKSGQLTESKEQNQQETNRLTSLKRTHSSEWNEKNDCICEKKSAVERPVSSGSDNSSTTSLAAQNRTAAQTGNDPDGTTTQKSPKTTLSTKDSSDELPQPVVTNTDSSNPVIHRLFVKDAPFSSRCLLSEDSRRRLDKVGTQSTKTPTATKLTSRNDRHDCTSTTNDKGRANVTNPRPASKQMSSSSRQGPSTSVRRSASTSGQFSEVRQRSASGGLSLSVGTSALTKGMSVSSQQLSSSKLKRSHSYSNTSTMDDPHTLTKDPSCSTTTQSDAKKRLRHEWRCSFPTNRDRKPSLGTEKLLRTTTSDSSRDARPGPSHRSRAPRQRHGYSKSSTPLMKKTKLEAIQRTKDINRTTSNGPSNFVGKDYKWAEKQRPTKEASSWKRTRYRSPTRRHQ